MQGLSSIKKIHHELTQANSKRLMLDKKARKKALNQLLQALTENEEKIFAATAKDLGRHHFETYVSEIAFIKDEIKLALTSMDEWCQKKLVYTPVAFQPASSYIEPTAKGVVLIMGTWNYPFQISLMPLVSAIASGNCAVVKPSELAPHSAELIAHMINNYLDPRCYRAVFGAVEVAQELLDLSFDHIFYTGSTTVGRQVLQKAAINLTPVTLELGGKSPCIVDETCDLSLSVKRILWGKLLNAGQTCIAPDYVLIKKDLVGHFIHEAKNQLLAMFGADAQKSTSYGRIVNDKHFARLLAYLQQGTIALGGNYDQASRFIEPTILTQITPHAPVMEEEIFGPILPLMTVENMEEAISYINSKPHPLALYIFSNNKNTVNKIIDNTLSGSVAINDCVTQVCIKGLPFGGVRHSGIGHYHGRFGFETFSHLRAIHKRANILDNPIKYAPYSEKKLKLARVLL